MCHETPVIFVRRSALRGAIEAATVVLGPVAVVRGSVVVDAGAVVDGAVEGACVVVGAAVDVTMVVEGLDGAAVDGVADGA